MTPRHVSSSATSAISTCTDLSTDVVKPGCHFLDLIQHRKETGSFDGDVEEFCSTILHNVAQGKVTHSIMESADGRSVQIVNKPLAQGGWVATIEDITERRNLEQERDRNYAFLRQIIDHIPSQITVKDARDRRYVLANRVAETPIRLVARCHRRQDRLRSVSEAARRDESPRMTTSRCNPPTACPGRAPLGKQGIGQPLHHLKAYRNPGSGRRDRAISSTSSKTSPSAGAPTRRSRILRITTR